MYRKELKKAGRKSFHKHYILLIFLCVIMSLFGTEASQSVQLLRRNSGEGGNTNTILHLEDVYDTISQEKADPSSLDMTTLFGSNAVVQSIITGDLDLGEEIADTIEENMPAEYGGIKALGFLSYVAESGVAVPAVAWGVLAIAFVASFAVSLVAIRFLMDFVKRHSFIPFGIYRILLGVFVLLYFLVIR